MKKGFYFDPIDATFINVLEVIKNPQKSHCAFYQTLLIYIIHNNRETYSFFLNL